MIHWHTDIYLVYVMDTYKVRTGILVYEYTITAYLCTSTLGLCKFTYPPYNTYMKCTEQGCILDFLDNPLS